MPKVVKSKSGIALFIVLATIFAILLLGDVTLNFLASQNRFSHEKVGRTQAYYAAMAGMNYALEMLRTGAWHYNSSADNSCPNSAPGWGCLMPLPAAPNDFPASISGVRIIFCDRDAVCQGPPPLNNEGPASSCNPPAGLNFCVNTSVTYSSP